MSMQVRRLPEAAERPLYKVTSSILIGVIWSEENSWPHAPGVFFDLPPRKVVQLYKRPF